MLWNWISRGEWVSKKEKREYHYTLFKKKANRNLWFNQNFNEHHQESASIKGDKALFNREKVFWAKFSKEENFNMFLENASNAWLNKQGASAHLIKHFLHFLKTCWNFYILLSVVVKSFNFEELARLSFA